MTTKLNRIAIVSMALFVVALPAQADDAYRASNGLLVLYDFAGKGETIRDRAGFGKPLDLRIENVKATRRVEGGLEIRSPAKIRSIGPASKIAKGVKRTNGFTIEAWLRPAKKNQTGPARIVSLSKSSTERNFTLGQENATYDVRFRTKNTDKNGLPSLSSPDNRFGLKKTHVVFTRDRSGFAKIFVDGRHVAEQRKKGTVDPWGDQFRLILGDEMNGQRPWLGTLYLVAIYDRPLSPEEIARHHRIGARNLAEDPKIAEARRREHFFESKIAPILSTHCLECHDSASNEGGLDLSRKKPALAGGDSGRAITPGILGDSLLWASIEDDQMPQDRPPLSSPQKELIRKWIEDGATWSVDYVDPAIYRNAREAELWVQRLTLPEYIETVRTAVGVDIAEEAERYLPRDKRADGFRNTAYNLTVDLEHVDAYSRLAEMIVAKMDVAQFARQFGKSRKLTDDNMRSLIAEMGKWIQRGPLADHEVVVYRGITTTVASAGGNFEEAVSLVLEAMLQSPRFLYRVEGQVGDGTVWPISQYELASRVSYILWGAPPDKELFRAADQGELADPEQFQRQVDRLLDHPLAIARSRQFVTEWLNLDRLANMRPSDEKFPDWDAQLADDMRVETLRFFEEIVWNENRPLSHLLNAQFTFLTPELAEHYGLPAVDGVGASESQSQSEGNGVDREGELARVDLTEIGSRGGLLTHGSVLTIGGDEASMVTRGLFVLNDLLFSEVGDPPPGLDTTPVPTSPGRTHRAIATERIESVSCGGCHARFEPLAFGLEKFDGLGSFHERDEHGNELREDGEILFPGDAEPVSYSNSHEMMNLLASSDRVQQCLTRKVVQFALGRPLVASDAAEIRAIHQASQKNGGTYRSLMVALVKSDLVQQTRTERAGE